MRVAFYSHEASAIAWARRLHDEGCDVLVYNEAQHAKKIGSGIVHLSPSKDTWLKWGLSDATTIFFFDDSSNDAGAELAERLRRAGRRVIGAGKFMHRLEKDRAFGEQLARSVGILCPPTKEFSDISSVVAFLKTNPRQEFGDGGWAWKPNKSLGCSSTFVSKGNDDMLEFLSYAQRMWGNSVSCIIQERIPGVALSTGRWFNGKSFVGPYEGTIEEKKAWDGDKGPATGCSLCLVWFYKGTPRVAEACKFAQLEALFRKNNAPPGLYDINAIVDKRGAWFLEWTPRLGIDSELNSQRGIRSLSQFLDNLESGKDVSALFNDRRCYTSVRVSVPPYPCDEEGVKDLKSALKVPVLGADGLWDKHFVMSGIALEKHGLEVVDPCGIVGVALADGTSLPGMCKRIYEYLKDGLRIANVQYRTDAYDIIKKDLVDMAKNGWTSTPVLRIV